MIEYFLMIQYLCILGEILSVFKYELSFNYVYYLYSMEQSDPEGNRLETTLKTQEKTILYAKMQIDDGELMTAKSILDQSHKKLQHLKVVESMEELQKRRVQLLELIELYYNQIRTIRSSKAKK